MPSTRSVAPDPHGEEETLRADLQPMLDDLRARIPENLCDDLPLEDLIHQLEEIGRRLDATVGRLKRRAELRALGALVERIQAKAPTDLTDEEIDREVKESIAEARAERRARRS